MRTAVLFITWACNYKCPYCWEVQAGYKPEKFKDAQEWIDAINKLNLDILDISGGEPYLQPELFKIINECNAKRVALTTNLHFDPMEIVNNVSNKKLFSITASFHPTQGVTVEDFKEKVERLRSFGFNVTVNFVMYPDQLWLAEKVKAVFSRVHFDRYAPTEFKPYTPSEEERAKINEYVKGDRPETVKQEGIKFCSGGAQHFNIQENGDVFRCIQDKTLGKPKVGNIFDPEYVSYGLSTPCEDWWRCSGCDRDKVRLTNEQENL